MHLTDYHAKFYAHELSRIGGEGLDRLGRGLFDACVEVDVHAFNAWCKKQKVSVLDGEFSLIYINRDHHVETLRRDDQT